MRVIAKSLFVKTSPRKLGEVAPLIRGKKAISSLDVLENTDRIAAKYLFLTLKQGVANAVNNFKLDKESLIIKEVVVGKGPFYKRGKPVSRGRWHPIMKRTSHVMIALEGVEPKKLEEKTTKKSRKEVKKENGAKS